MTIRSPLFNVMEKAARKAARGLLHDFGEVEQLQVSQKGPADFVSQADTKTENTLRAELSKARPGFGFVLEEGGEIIGNDGEHRWVIDPLDGTTNFLHGIPHFSMSIALEKYRKTATGVRREIIAGMVYEPIRDEMFFAEKGQGAFLNGKRLRVSGRAKLADCVFATGVPVQGRSDPETFLAELSAMMSKVSSIHRMGSAALDLAYVSAGRYDGYWERNLKAWDIASGLLLIREAGGYVSEIDGGSDMLESGSVLVSNDKLHAEFGRVIRDADKAAAKAAAK